MTQYNPMEKPHMNDVFKGKTLISRQASANDPIPRVTSNMFHLMILIIEELAFLLLMTHVLFCSTTNALKCKDVNCTLFPLKRNP